MDTFYSFARFKHGYIVSTYKFFYTKWPTPKKNDTKYIPWPHILRPFFH